MFLGFMSCVSMSVFTPGRDAVTESPAEAGYAQFIPGEYPENTVSFYADFQSDAYDITGLADLSNRIFAPPVVTVFPLASFPYASPGNDFTCFTRPPPSFYKMS